MFLVQNLWRMRAASASSRRISSRRARSSAWSAGRARRSCLVGVGLRGVDLGAVGEQDPERVERVVAVLRDAAAHPGGVVGEDAADHGRVDRGRVGAEAGLVGGEEAVQVGADHPRLRPDPRPVVEHPRPAEERADLDEDVVAHRLPRERGARGPERQVAAAARGPGEQIADLADAARPDDRLRDRAGRSTRRRSGRGGRSGARGRGRARGSARGRPRLRGRQVAWCLR